MDERIQRLKRNLARLTNEPAQSDSIADRFNDDIQLFLQEEAAGWKNLMIPHAGGHVPFHRRNAPFTEWRDAARSMTEVPELLVCIGTGFGYQLTTFLQFIASIHETVIIETCFEALYLFMTEFELDNLLPPEVKILFAEQPETACNYLQKRLHRYHPTGMELVPLQSLADLQPEYAHTVMETINNNWNRHRVFLNSLAVQAMDISEHVHRNIEGMAGASTIVRGSGAGARAFIVASGPSLDAGIPYLRSIREYATLIAVGSALHPLLSTGIEPDMVIVSDPQKINARHFPEERYTIPLVLDPVVDDSIVRRFRGERLLIHNGHSVSEFLARNFSLASLSGWGTVTSSALSFCEFAGFDEIALIGSDFAFTSGAEHVNNYLLDSTLGEVIDVPDWKGRMVSTNRIFEQYARFFDGQIARLAAAGIRVIDCCEMSIFGAGEKLSIRDYLRELKRHADPRKSISLSEPLDLSPARVEEVKRLILAELAEAIVISDNLLDGSMTMTEFFSLVPAAMSEGMFLEPVRSMEAALMAGDRKTAETYMKTFRTGMRDELVRMVMALEKLRLSLT